MMIFSPVGGIDIEQVAEISPIHRRPPFLDDCPGQRLHGQGDDRLDRRDRVESAMRITPILTQLARLFLEYDMTLAEINPLGELDDGSFVALDAHMDMENEARPRQKALLKELGGRRGDPRGPRASPSSSWPARRSTRWTTAAWPAT